MSCGVYTKSFINDIDYESGYSLNINWLKSLIPSISDSEYGVWAPIFINGDYYQVINNEPLKQVDTSYAKTFNPCNCDDSQILGDDTSYLSSAFESDIDTSYCGNTSKEWFLYDNKGDKSPISFTANCSNGACDIASKNDDFLPKVPVLNQIYLSKFYDFKWLNQFPAMTNPGRGNARFFSTNNFKKLQSTTVTPSFCIDWNIHPTISEIEYDPVTSHHTSKARHEKAYARSQATSKTCGNFLLLSISKDYYETYAKASPILNNYSTTGNSFDPNRTIDIPAKEDFTKPYGWKNRTYDNIFVGEDKVGSYWKWDINKAILCWYRYYDTNRVNDLRPIPGVDLYISPGDVFWAQNDGPERSPTDVDIASSSSEIKICPSGLKLVDGLNIIGIIPDRSSFLYISENIYSRFHDLYEIYRNDFKVSDSVALYNAAVLCTAPLYDGFTTDLLDIQEAGKYYKGSYAYNKYGQADILNQLMSKGTYYDSANDLNFISNTVELVNTLYDKYGGYIWIPPNTVNELSFNLAERSKSMLVDMDFDCIPDRVPPAWRNVNPKNSCDNIKQPKYNYSYEQEFSFGGMTFVSFIDPVPRYDQTCKTFSKPSGTGVMYYNQLVDHSHTIYGGTALNNNIIDSYPIYSGLTQFYDIYPRISTSGGNRGYCSDCGPYSSWGLANAADQLCDPPVVSAASIELSTTTPTPTPSPLSEELRILETSYSPPETSAPPAEEDETFCLFSLARAYNLIDSGTREPRIIADNTHYFYRNYSALCHNPHISTIAFHQNGGIFYDSIYSENKTIFDRNLAGFDVNANNLRVKFATKDVGIKIYDIHLRKLQSNEPGTETCERFPIDTENTCKCYGLNLNRFSQHPKACTDANTQSYVSSSLYVPGLSTRFSPAIEYYGGYSDDELWTLFGVGGHVRPRTEYGDKPNILPILPQMRDPENPYSCNKYASITLTNYTKSSYDLTLKNFSTRHADVLLTVYENADLTGGPISFSQDEEGNDTSSTNIYWKRFLTKVVANEVTVYNQQKHVVIPSTINIAKNYTLNATLINPYLTALIGSETQLAFPTGDPYEQDILIGSSRGDETSVVTLTFQQRPRKQLLNFRMASPYEPGTNKTSFWNTSNSSLFYPNLGLLGKDDSLLNSREFQSGAIDEKGYIDYYRGNPSTVQWSYLTKRYNDVIDKISNFSKHRKFRIYRGVGKFISAAYIPNRGGYKFQDIEYIGVPHLFEYAKSSQNTTSNLIPAIPKKSVVLDYILREQPGIRYYGDSSYKKILNKPYADIGYEEDEFIFDYNDLRVLKIPGTREYFRTTQRNKIWWVDANDETIESIIIGLKNQGIIGSETETTDEETGVTTTEPAEHKIKTFDLIERRSMRGYYYAFMGGDPEQTYNYLYIGTNSDIFFLRSSLDIDYSNVAKNGYLYNTGKPCEEDVEIIYSGNREGISSSNQIIRKNLYVEFYNNRGQRVRYDAPENKYYKTYTILTFRDKVTPPNNEEKIEAIHRKNKTSLLLYNNVLNMRESDPLLNNPSYQTKWGDLIRYDGDFLNNPHIIEYHRNDTPLTPYHNLFYKQIVNDYNDAFYFTINTRYGNTYVNLREHYEKPYFNILQKYDIERDKPWAPPSQQYENYLPIMEVTYPLYTSFDQYQLKGGFTSSALYNSYINEDLPAGVFDPDTYPMFFHNARFFEPIFHPPDVFYNETLRVDDPIFVLNKTIRKDQTSNRPDARKIFKPANMEPIVNNLQALGVGGKIINRSHPFYLKNAYADLDIPGPCAPQKCSMSTAGYISLYSEFKSASLSNPKDYGSTLVHDTSQISISYDGGLYNPIGDSRYISIQRTELDYGSPFDSEITCSTTHPLPTTANQTFLSSYQEHVDTNFSHYNGSLPSAFDERNVAVMDRHANEMLFRIYYGEKQKINRKQAYIDKEPLNLEDLVGYTEPKITPRYLYDEILYNYDQYTKQNISFNGSLKIYGTKEPGDNINMIVAGVSINLSLQSDQDGSLRIYGNVGKHTVNQKIYDRTLILKRLITTDYYVADPGPPGYRGENGEENRISPNVPPPDPLPTSDNQTIKLVASHTYEGSAGWTTVMTPNYDFPDTGMTPYGNGNTGVGANIAVVYRDKQPETFLCHDTSKSYDPYVNGYCSIDDDPKGEGCDSCDNFDGIDVRVFDYYFEQCSVGFNLKGHSYRKKYSGPDNEDPIEEENQNSNYVAPVGESTETAEAIEDISDECNPPVPDCAVNAIGYGCWVEKCYSYWINPYTCTKRKNPSSNRLIRKVFVSESSSDMGEYKPPVCPSYFIDISYDNKSVTVSIPKSKAMHYVDPQVAYTFQGIEYIDFCAPINVTNGCPDIWIGSIPKKYNIVETINSSCESCPQDASVELTAHQNSYQYKDFTAVCEVGRMTYGDLQGSPIVTVGIRADDGTDDFGRSFPPCYGNVGGLTALCDGGLPWTSCVNGTVLKSGKNVQNKCGTNTADDPSIIECDGGIGVDRGWLAQENASIWMENITKQFEKSFLGSGPSAYAGGLHDAFVRPQIPTSDIIKGVIPGSATLNFETQGVDIPKFRPLPDGGVEESTWTVYTTIAYIKYTYRAPDTLNILQNKDVEEGGIIKEYDNNNVLIGIKTNNALENCTFNPFPETYYSYSNLGNPVRLNPTYLSTKADLTKDSCTSGFRYYDKYSKQQTICNQNDWLCWAAMDSRNTNAFLSRMFDENWI